MGRSWRASISSSSIAWLASAFVSASSCGELDRRLHARRLEPQQQRGQRLVDLVVEVAGDARALLLLRGERGARGPAPLGLEALEHAPEGALEPRHLLGLAAPVGGAAQVGARAGEVGALHLVHQPLQGPEAALEHEHVDEDRQRDRERRGPAPARAARRGRDWVAGDAGRDHRGDDQQQVRDQDLGEEVLAAHLTRKYRPAQPMRGVRGSTLADARQPPCRNSRDRPLVE